MSDTLLRFLSVLIPHVTVTAVLVALLLRAVRRYERRADAIIAEMDVADGESQRQFDRMGVEIRESMRAQVDRAIEEAWARVGSVPRPEPEAPAACGASGVEVSRTGTEHPVSPECEPPRSEPMRPGVGARSVASAPVNEPHARWPSHAALIDLLKLRGFDLPALFERSGSFFPKSLRRSPHVDHAVSVALDYMRSFSPPIADVTPAQLDDILRVGWCPIGVVRRGR